jgi:hypothetical protein
VIGSPEWNYCVNVRLPIEGVATYEWDEPVAIPDEVARELQSFKPIGDDWWKLTRITHTRRHVVVQTRRFRCKTCHVEWSRVMVEGDQCPELPCPNRCDRYETPRDARNTLRQRAEDYWRGRHEPPSSEG